VFITAAGTEQLVEPGQAGGQAREARGESHIEVRQLALASELTDSTAIISGRCRSVRVMDMVRQVIVFDAADLHAESAFWAGILGGHVFKDDGWHSVIDAAGQWRIGVQLAPDHVPPDWPDGTPQQVHLDLHVDDPRAAHEEAIALGARLLQPAPDLDAAEGRQVYADPAGHPFCIGWGHPSREVLAEFVRAGKKEIDQTGDPTDT
jgi:hypothetical protein